MATKAVSEAIARPVRTGIQMAPAAVVTELLDVFVIDFDERGYAAVFAGLTLLFAGIQNAMENAKQRGWWLRTVPPTDAAAGGA